MKQYLVLDVGGSSIKYALIDENRNFIEKGKTDHAPKDSCEEFVEEVGKLYDLYADRIEGIGISMAGKLNPSDGYIVSAGNFPALQGKKLPEILKERCPVRIAVENDGRCAALAELHYGCLQDVNDALVLVIGSGIGGSFIHNRELYYGRRYCATEFSVLRTEGDRTDLGSMWFFKNGIPGLIAMAKKALNTDRELNGIEIFRLANEGDERMLSGLDQFCQSMAVQLYNLQALFDVEKIAIGGGISAQPLLFELTKKHLREIYDGEAKYGLPPVMPEVIPCTYGNDANLLGAYYRLIHG